MSSPSEAQVDPIESSAEASSALAPAYARADKFVEYQNYFQASKEYEQLIDEHPNDALLYSKFASTLLGRRKYLEAADKSLKAIELDPIVAAEKVDLNNAYGIFRSAVRKLTKDQQSVKSKELANVIPVDGQRRAVALRCWADELFNAGDYKEAVEQYTQSAAIDPGDFIAWSGLGRSLLKLNRPLVEFDKALSDHPKARAPIYKGWGHALAACKQYDQAVEKYEHALAIEPADAEARISLADVLLSCERYADAIQHYLRALEIDVSNLSRINFRKWVTALTNLSGAEHETVWTRLQTIVEKQPRPVTVFFDLRGKTRLGAKPAESEQAYARAAKIFAHSPEVLKRWANALYHEGPDRYAEAVDKYLKAMELGAHLYARDYEQWDSAFSALADTHRQASDERLQQLVARSPELTATYVGWGDALLGKEKYPEAAQKYESAIRIRDEDSPAHAGLAKALQHEHKAAAAIEHFLKACELDLTVIDCDEWIEALDHISEAGRREATQKFLTIASNGRPDAAKAHRVWGRRLYDLKRYSEAIDRYRRAADLDPESIDVLSGWGWSLQETGYYSEAAVKYQRITELDPGHEDSQTAFAWENWAATLFNRGRYTEAAEKYQTAIALSPTADLYLRLGDVLSSQRKWAKWAENCQKAIEDDEEKIVAYLNWGAALLGLDRESEALEKYDRAIQMSPDTEPDLADRYYYWGNALADQNRIAQALEKYREAVRRNDQHAYALTNIAAYSNDQGQYRIYWSELDNAVRAYQRGLPNARKEQDSDYFRYYASILKELGRSDDAEKIYQEGLTLAPNHVSILTDLVDLYSDWAKNLLQTDGKPDREGRTNAHWRAREVYRRAQASLEREFDGTENARILVQWGSLHLGMEEYGKAREVLEKAIEKDPDSSDPHYQLGVLFMRQEEFQKAADCFRNALRRDPGKLAARSNLAEAYLKAGLPDKAETEYKSILSITANHVESEIGLGQVCIAMAEASKDGELYDDAVRHFMRAIDIGKSHPSSASKRMQPKEWAPVYYSIGYTQVKLYGDSKLKDEAILRQARENFKQCLSHDPEHHKAERALSKIRERLHPFSSERLLEKLAPYTIILMAAFVFVLVQVSFFSNGKFSELGYYVPVTFSSVALMIVGFYLPNLLKLKVAGIELEKSAVDQIASLSSIEISK